MEQLSASQGDVWPLAFEQVALQDEQETVKCHLGAITLSRRRVATCLWLCLFTWCFPGDEGRGWGPRGVYLSEHSLPSRHIAPTLHIAPHVNSIKSPPRPSKVGTITLLILQMGKPRHKALSKLLRVTQLVSGRAGFRWTPSGQALASVLLTAVPHLG